MTEDMGLGRIGGTSVCFKHKFRWQMFVAGVTDASEGTDVVIPEKSARPSLSFKEVEAQHLNETIYRPSKPEWKPINLIVYDVAHSNSPVFAWLREQYDPCPKSGKWYRPGPGRFIKDKIYLTLFDGCGRILEIWTYENVWPNSIDWGELEMGNSGICYVDLTLRYDRAYQVVPSSQNPDGDFC